MAVPGELVLCQKQLGVHPHMAECKQNNTGRAARPSCRRRASATRQVQAAASTLGCSPTPTRAKPAGLLRRMQIRLGRSPLPGSTARPDTAAAVADVQETCTCME